MGLHFLRSTLALSFTLAAALLAASPAPADAPDGGDGADAPMFEATSRHDFADVEHWQKVFDDPGRDAWQRPELVVEKLALREGMRVADLGAGTGYFSRYLSAAVGPTGTVYAVETEPALVTHLRDRAETEGSDNLIPVLASSDDSRLPLFGIDLVLVVDTFHHIDDRLEYFDDARRRLRPAGRVAVIDWKKKELPVGPGLDHKIARGQVVEEMERAGYELADESTDLPYQYFLIFRPRSRPAAGRSD